MKTTLKAHQKIDEFLAKETAEKVFRVKVNSGGCSGFSYITEITDPEMNDIKLYPDARIVIDSMSNNILMNTTLDYVEAIGQSGFIFTNPDASSTCGCGMSFDF